MDPIYQLALPTITPAQQKVINRRVRANCRAMLKAQPETRTDYWLAYITYLALYHDLDRHLKLKIHNSSDLLNYLTDPNIPKFRTVANRCQEEMRRHPELRPANWITQYRKRQAHVKDT
jgi:hypothetical protein